MANHICKVFIKATDNIYRCAECNNTYRQAYRTLLASVEAKIEKVVQCKHCLKVLDNQYCSSYCRIIERYFNS